MMNIKVSCPFKTVVYYDNETKSYPVCHYKGTSPQGCRITEGNDCTNCDIKSKTSTQLKKLYEKMGKKSVIIEEETDKIEHGYTGKMGKLADIPEEDNDVW